MLARLSPPAIITTTLINVSEGTLVQVDKAAAQQMGPGGTGGAPQGSPTGQPGAGEKSKEKSAKKSTK